MKKIVFSTLLAIISFTLTFASETAVNESSSIQVNTNSISGKVIDKSTNETLVGVAVVANGQKVYTDLDGNFTLSKLCSGNCELSISLISYEPRTINVNLDNTKNLDIVLKQR